MIIVRLWCVCSREVIYMSLVSQVSGHVKNINIVIFSDTMIVKNV